MQYLFSFLWWKHVVVVVVVVVLHFTTKNKVFFCFFFKSTASQFVICCLVCFHSARHQQEESEVTWRESMNPKPVSEWVFRLNLWEERQALTVASRCNYSWCNNILFWKTWFHRKQQRINSLTLKSRWRLQLQEVKRSQALISLWQPGGAVQEEESVMKGLSGVIL